jgi:hypothetical protein
MSAVKLQQPLDNVMFAYVNCYYGVIHGAMYVKRSKAAIKKAGFSSQNSDNAL